MRVNGDSVYLAESTVCRISAGPNPDKPDDSFRALRNPPSARYGLGEIASPAFGKFRCNGSIGVR